MDSREQRSEAAATSWLSGFALIATLAFGFHDFPEHAGLIASAAILAHLIGESVMAYGRLSARRREITSWIEALTLRFGLLDLASRIAKGNPPPPEDEFGGEDYWRQHQKAAVSDIKRAQADDRSSEALGVKVRPRVWIAVVSSLGFYFVVVLIALGLAALT